MSSDNNDKVILLDTPIYKQKRFLIGGGIGLVLMSGILCYCKYKK